jgi:hypothetical protein
MTSRGALDTRLLFAPAYVLLYLQKTYSKTRVYLFTFWPVHLEAVLRYSFLGRCGW